MNTCAPEIHMHPVQCCLFWTPALLLPCSSPLKGLRWGQCGNASVCSSKTRTDVWQRAAGLSCVWVANVIQKTYKAIQLMVGVAMTKNDECGLWIGSIKFYGFQSLTCVRAITILSILTLYHVLLVLFLWKYFRKCAISWIARNFNGSFLKILGGLVLSVKVVLIIWQCFYCGLDQKSRIWLIFAVREEKKVIFDSMLQCVHQLLQFFCHSQTQGSWRQPVVCLLLWWGFH